MQNKRPILGAIAVVIHDECVLLIKRKNAPSASKWAYPGGGVELGETALDAAARELLEETGVVGIPERYLTNVDVILRDADGRPTQQYLLAVVVCRYVSGAPVAADDALDARWVAFADVAGFDTTENVGSVLELALS